LPYFENIRSDERGFCLSQNELAEVIGCKPSSFSCMRKWLQKNDWPYVVSKSGFPKVAREFYWKVMVNYAETKNNQQSPEPYFHLITRKNI